MLRAERPISLPSYEIPTGLNFLVDHAKKEDAKPSIWPGDWQPVYTGDPSTALPHLYTVFKNLRQKISATGPIQFFDFGGGPGIVAATAALAGFNGVSIEIQEIYSAKAKLLKSDLVSKGILDEANLQILHGSYYTTAAWDWIKAFGSYILPDSAGLLIGELAITAPGGMKVLIDTPVEEKAAMEQRLVQAAFEKIEPDVDVFQRNNLLDSRDLLPQNSVVYSYISDPFCEMGGVFTQQLVNILHPGSYVLLGNTSHLENMVRGRDLEDFEYIGAYITPNIETHVETLFLFRTPAQVSF